VGLLLPNLAEWSKQLFRPLVEVHVPVNGMRSDHQRKARPVLAFATLREWLAGDTGHLMVVMMTVVGNAIDTRFRDVFPRLIQAN
jgi:hypothetical protein